MEKVVWEVREYEGNDPVPINQFQKAAISALYNYWLKCPNLTLGQAISELTLEKDNWINWDEMEWVQYIQDEINTINEIEKLYNTNE